MHAGSVLWSNDRTQPVCAEGSPRFVRRLGDGVGDGGVEMVGHGPDAVGPGHEVEHLVSEEVVTTGAEEMLALRSTPPPMADWAVTRPSVVTASPTPTPTLTHGSRRRVRAWRTGFSTSRKVAAANASATRSQARLSGTGRDVRPACSAANTKTGQCHRYSEYESWPSHRNPRHPEQRLGADPSRPHAARYDQRRADHGHGHQ